MAELSLLEEDVLKGPDSIGSMEFYVSPKLARRTYSFECSQDILGAPDPLHGKRTNLIKTNESAFPAIRFYVMDRTCIYIQNRAYNPR